MPIHRFVFLFALAPVLLGSVAACTSLLGDFEVNASDTDASVAGAADAESGADALGASPLDSARVPDDADMEACVPESDAQLCAKQGKNCDGLVATDSCGAARAIHACGTCVAPETCGAKTPNVCDCPVETDAMFCARLGKNCGPVTAADSCGKARAVASCGAACTAPQTCGAHVANVCGDPVCTPETDAQLCARYGKNCNSFSNLDDCGVSRTVDCGPTCPQFQTCGAVVANLCGCVPESDSAFCASRSFTCGAQSGTDNCGAPRAASCGSCTGGNTCDSGTCLCNGGAACTGAATCCGSGCVDVNGSDPSNCGGCGRICSPGDGWSCVNGGCACIANQYRGRCGAACQKLSANPNCGACGVTCGNGQTCCSTDIVIGWSCNAPGAGGTCP